MQPLIIIQCRFSSNRLHGKVLYPLNGLPILVFLIHRIKNANLQGKIVVATTECPEDDIVVAWAEQESVAVVRGEMDDVLSRYIKCVKTFPSDFVIRVTADNPLTDPVIINLVIDEMKKGSWDYVSAVNGYPYGAGVDAFKSTLLTILDKKTQNKLEREHINAYILENEHEFRCRYISPPEEQAREDVKVTIDTFEDWQRINKLLKADLSDAIGISLIDAIKRFDSLSF